MKKTTLMLLLCLSCKLLFAQNGAQTKDQVLLRFKAYYNAAQHDSIFEMFSPETKISLPLDRTTGFLNQLKTRFGNLQSFEFTGVQSSFSVYKTQFEKGRLLLQLSFNEKEQITGLFAKPDDTPTLDSVRYNVTPMQLPFKGTWTVFWGGDTRAQNQHVGVKFQQHAFDLVITDAQHKSYRSDGKTNADYYAFGQAVTSPCDGVVVSVVDGVPDNLPGVVNALYVPGNTVILKTANDEYVFMAHFKQHSIQVKQGEVLKKGQVVGQCGNSGNSSEPHLHFHLQDAADPLQASGIKCNFKLLIVNGVLKTNFSPVKSKLVSNP